MNEKKLKEIEMAKDILIMERREILDSFMFKLFGKGTIRLLEIENRLNDLDWHEIFYKYGKEIKGR